MYLKRKAMYSLQYSLPMAFKNIRLTSLQKCSMFHTVHPKSRQLKYVSLSLSLSDLQPAWPQQLNEFPFFFFLLELFLACENYSIMLLYQNISTTFLDTHIPTSLLQFLLLHCYQLPSLSLRLVSLLIPPKVFWNNPT